MAESIDSPRNARVVAARALLTRKGRTAAGALLVEGPHAVGEVLDAAGFDVREVFVTDAAATREVGLLRRLAGRGTLIHTVTERAAKALGDTVHPQGVVAVVRRTGPSPALPARPGLVAVLDSCADPGNAGTAIRTAAAAGADAVVLSSGSVDVWSGKCVRASAGAVFHLPVLTGLATVDVATELRGRGCRLLGTAADGSADLDGLIAGNGLDGPTAWFFGSEAHGLPDDVRTALDATVRIPLYGRAESLNLAASVAICLYASARLNR
jgi:TrmH family RNA methyltransferase